MPQWVRFADAGQILIGAAEWFKRVNDTSVADFSQGQGILTVIGADVDDTVYSMPRKYIFQVSFDKDVLALAYNVVAEPVSNCPEDIHIVVL